MRGQEIDTSGELSRSEWEVMQVVWDRVGEDPEVAVSEILPEIQSKKKWHVSTLKTTMERLVKKGYLASRIRGKTCFYRPTKSRQATTKRSLTKFLDLVLGSSFNPLVAYLAERKKLSDREIEALEKLLEEHREPKK